MKSWRNLSSEKAILETRNGADSGSAVCMRRLAGNGESIENESRQAETGKPKISASLKRA
jgi:hypothetical protein